MTKSKLAQQRNGSAIVVVGMGATGLSVARFLDSRNVSFTVVDSRDNPPGLARLRDQLPEVPVYCGSAAQAAIRGAMELIVSPGVSLAEPWLREALEGGAQVRGDIDLFVEEAGAPVVGITGSNAKSTVTALLGAMAVAAGRRVGVGGNIGTPALDTLSPDNELYVTELSSFQLERARDLDLAVATILNLTPDHLDRHGSFRAYRRAKHRIYAAARCVVFNAEDDDTVPPSRAGVARFGWRVGEPGEDEFGVAQQDGEPWLSYGRTGLMSVSELALPGQHNVANALAALTLGHAVQLPMEAMLAALRTFSGLPHRCELVAESAGIRWYNDSKATNVGAALAAVTGLGAEQPLVLIAGGQGKGADFGELLEPVRQYCRAVLLIGEAAPELQALFAGSVPCEVPGTLDVAIAHSRELANPGDAVLLSPACASFDQYVSYEARGDRFRNLVREFADLEPSQ